MKKYLLKHIVIIFLFALSVEGIAQARAQGLFMSIGVGPRFPIGGFTASNALGYGFNLEFSYSDTDVLPLFVYGSVGFEQYPGSLDFYRRTQYTNFHTNAIPVNIGLRHYFSPLVEDAILLMPIVQASISFNHFEKLHQFKMDLGLSNYIENNSKLGFSAGVGVSMFLLELLVSYNFYESNQFIGLDLKARLPIFINY